MRDGDGSIAARYNLLGIGAIFGGYLEPRSGERFVGIGAVYLFDDQSVQLTGDIQFSDHNGLHVIGRMIAGAGAGVGVLVDGALAPHALSAQIQDILRPVTERSAVHYIVNAGIAGMLQIVIHAQQFLSAGSHGVGEQTGLVSPDDGLHPGVHGPGVVAAPHIVHAQGLGLVGEHTCGMGIEIGHHGTHGGVVDGLGLAPGLALQRPAHAFALFGAEAHGALSVEAEVHLVEMALAQGRGIIFDPVVGAVIHLNGIRRGGEG